MALQDLSKDEEQSIVLETINDLLLKMEDTNNFCHSYGHHLGEFLFDYVRDVNQAFSSSDQVLCGGATYHGIVQNFMISEVTENNISPTEIDISEICPEDSEHPHAIERWECLHGIGHGLTITHDYDIFAAVERCNEFEHGWESVSCAKGLFMENVNNYYRTGIGTIKEDDVLFPCNTVDEKFAPPCYHYQVTHISKIKNGDVIEMFEECNKIPNFAKYCYRGMGKALAPTIYFDKDKSATCLIPPIKFQTDCYKGVAMLFADNRSTEEALGFCKIIPEEFKMDCYGEVGKWIHMVYSTEEDRQEECSKAEKPYFDVCINSSLDGISIL